MAEQKTMGLVEFVENEAKITRSLGKFINENLVQKIATMEDHYKKHLEQEKAKSETFLKIVLNMGVFGLTPETVQGTMDEIARYHRDQAEMMKVMTSSIVSNHNALKLKEMIESIQSEMAGMKNTLRQIKKNQDDAYDTISRVYDLSKPSDKDNLLYDDIHTMADNFALLTLRVTGLQACLEDIKTTTEHTLEAILEGDETDDESSTISDTEDALRLLQARGPRPSIATPPYERQLANRTVYDYEADVTVPLEGDAPAIKDQLELETRPPTPHPVKKAIVSAKDV